MFDNFPHSLKSKPMLSFLVAALLAIPSITSCDKKESNHKAGPGLLALALNNAGIYAAGFSTNSSGVMAAGYWKNGVWNELTPLDTTKHSAVNSIVVTQDTDRKSTRLNSSHLKLSRMPSSA